MSVCLSVCVFVYTLELKYTYAHLIFITYLHFHLISR